MISSIIIFSKTPLPGLVKTRLAQTTCLTETESARIARAMLQDTIALASESSATKIHIGFFPAESHDLMMNVIDSVRNDGYLKKNVELFMQNGSNFDQRFTSIVKASFKCNIDYSIILGADLPFLDPQIINMALETLTSKINDKPLIIGPSSGGGIYLIGINKDFNPNWFNEYKLFESGIELAQFSSLSIKKKLKLVILPPYGDVDLEEDLVSLISYIKVLDSAELTTGFHFPYYTAKVVDELGLYIIDEKEQTRKRKIAKKTYT